MFKVSNLYERQVFEWNSSFTLINLDDLDKYDNLDAKSASGDLYIDKPGQKSLELYRFFKKRPSDAKAFAKGGKAASLDELSTAADGPEDTVAAIERTTKKLAEQLDRLDEKSKAQEVARVTAVLHKQPLGVVKEMLAQKPTETKAATAAAAHVPKKEETAKPTKDTSIPSKPSKSPDKAKAAAPDNKTAAEAKKPKKVFFLRNVPPLPPPPHPLTFFS